MPLPNPKIIEEGSRGKKGNNGNKILPIDIYDNNVIYSDVYEGNVF